VVLPKTVKTAENGSGMPLHPPSAYRVLLIAVLPLLTAEVRAETAVQAGLWEKTEKVTVDGRDQPSRPRSVCLQQGEASLERLLMMNDEEAAARGCRNEVARPRPGIARMSMACPAKDDEPAVVATMEVRYTATSFEGSGSVEIKAKDGSAQKGASVLSGKRLGDC
jgi:hypothetical protein